jgi:hypothetical protein
MLIEGKFPQRAYDDRTQLFGSAPGPKAVTTSLTADPTTNNCVTWIAGGGLGDAGAACGGGGSGFTTSTRLWNSSNQSITTSVLTAVTFDTERYDNGSMHSTVTNTSRITMPSTGVYIVGCGLDFAFNATGDREVGIRLNGTTYIALELITASAGTATRPNVLATYSFSSSDYIECIAFQTSGVSLNVSSGSDYSPTFTAARIQ